MLRRACLPFLVQSDQAFDLLKAEHVGEGGFVS
jgi:hypothetical protein